MAGQIIISNIKTDSDNAFSILANTGAVIFSANLASGITTNIANTRITGTITAGQLATSLNLATNNVQVASIQSATGTPALVIAANGQLSRVNTAIISDGTYSTSANNVIQGSAKAWVRFSVSGSTVTVNGNYNLSSVSRSQAGFYVFSFTTNLPDANYSVVTSQGLDTSSGTSMIPILFRNASGNLTPTTSSFSVVFVAPSTGTAYDPIVVGLVVNGN